MIAGRITAGRCHECGARAYKDSDLPDGTVYCHEHFYPAYTKWRAVNRTAGLCPCGQSPVEGYKSCAGCLEDKRALRRFNAAMRRENERKEEEWDRLAKMTATLPPGVESGHISIAVYNDPSLLVDRCVVCRMPCTWTGVSDIEEPGLCGGCLDALHPEVGKSENKRLASIYLYPVTFITNPHHRRTTP